MARRRGSGNPQTNPEGLGVGALAEGELAHGERPIVESLAGGPAGPAPGGPEPQGGQPPQGGAGMDLFGPSTHPGEPITSGVGSGPGAPGGQVLDNDPDEVLRMLYEVMPHDDIRMLMEGRQF